MRDIRDDLHERATFLVGQINLAQGQFDKLMEQLKVEHDIKLHNLKGNLDAVNMVAIIEDRRLGSYASANKAKNQIRPPQPPLQQVQPQHPRSAVGG